MWKDVARNMDREKALALVYGTLSAFMTAVHAVLVKSAVKTLEGSVLRLTYWSNMMSGMFLVRQSSCPFLETANRIAFDRMQQQLPCLLLNGEVSIFMNKIVFASTTASSAAAHEIYERSVERSTFFIGSLVTGFFGFLLGLAGLLSIKVTSPVSHMVSSAARSVLQTVLGVWFFGEIVTGRRALSIMVITLGALYYTWVQSAFIPSSSSSIAEDDDDEDEDEDDGEMEEGKSKTRNRKSRRNNSRTPREWYRQHGHTHSLATLLPLHAPRALHPFPPAPRSPPISGQINTDATGEARSLGSISEEEEYHYPSIPNGGASGAGAGTEGGGSVVDEEKMALLPEDDVDRARLFRDHVRVREYEREYDSEKV